MAWDRCPSLFIGSWDKGRSSCMYLSSLVPRFHVTLNPSSLPLGGLSDGSDQVSVREWAAADTLRCVTFPGAAERIFQMFYVCLA